MSDLLIEQERKAEPGLSLADFSDNAVRGNNRSLESENSALSFLDLALAKKPDSLILAAAPKDKAADGEKHTMSSRVLSWGWTFDIKDANGKSEGIVDQKVLNLRKTFEYKDENGKTKSTGQERLFSWGTSIDVYDETGKPIGGIHEQLFKNWFHTYTVYSIVDAQGKELAKSAKLELGATDFTLTNPKGEKIATMHRPWLNWVRDNWSISIQKPQEVDKRILYMIPAYKTAADAERKAKEEAEQEEEDRRKKNSTDDD